MLIAAEIVKLADKSLPLRGAWIEMLIAAEIVKLADKSLPLRGAWIEIGRNAKAYPLIIVAPLAGGVD